MVEVGSESGGTGRVGGTKKTIRPVRWEDVKREDIRCPEPWHNWEAVTMAAGEGVPEALNYTRVDCAS